MSQSTILFAASHGFNWHRYEGPSEGYVAIITQPTRQGGIVSIYYLGTLMGCLMGGVLGDRYETSVSDDE